MIPGSNATQPVRLLQQVVEITPGEPGQFVVAGMLEEPSLPGCVVVRIENRMNRDNAFDVRLRCLNSRLWQRSWPKISSAGTLNITEQQDKVDPSGGFITYVAAGASRDVLIRFDVRRKPLVRAGRYDLQVEVRSRFHVEGMSGECLEDLHLLAVVLPFYEWSAAVVPESQRVGMFRRRKPFALQITNEGNDWLYCQVSMPSTPDLKFECSALRVAVPPAVPEDTLPAEGMLPARTGARRNVPFSVKSDLKVWKGEPRKQPFMPTLRRVEAPSVLRLVSGSAESGTVLWTIAADSRQVEGTPGLEFQPPLNFLNLFTASGNTLRNVAMTIIGIFVAANLLILGIGVFVNSTMSISTNTFTGRAGDQIGLKAGNYLGTVLLGHGTVQFTNATGASLGSDAYCHFSGQPRCPVAFRVPDDWCGQGKLVVHAGVPVLTYLAYALGNLHRIRYGGSDNRQDFTVIGCTQSTATPTVSSGPPQGAPLRPGQQCTLFGNDLTKANCSLQVNGGGVNSPNWPMSFSPSGNSASFASPQLEGSYQLALVDKQHKQLWGGAYQVAKPHVNPISPGPYPQGQPVQVSGSGLSGCTVQVDGQAPATAVDTGASVVAPSQPGTYTVTVRGPDGSSVSSGSITVSGDGSSTVSGGGPSPHPNPHVNPIRSGPYPPRANVRVSGSNLGGCTVQVDDQPQVTASANGASVIAPSQPGTYTVTVRGPDGNSVSSGSVTVSGGSSPPDRLPDIIKELASSNTRVRWKASTWAERHMQGGQQQLEALAVEAWYMASNGDRESVATSADTIQQYAEPDPEDPARSSEAWAAQPQWQGVALAAEALALAAKNDERWKGSYQRSVHLSPQYVKMLSEAVQQRQPWKIPGLDTIGD